MRLETEMAEKVGVGVLGKTILRWSVVGKVILTDDLEASGA